MANLLRTRPISLPEQVAAHASFHYQDVRSPPSCHATVMGSHRKSAPVIWGRGLRLVHLRLTRRKSRDQHAKEKERTPWTDGLAMSLCRDVEAEGRQSRAPIPSLFLVAVGGWAAKF